MGVKFATSFEPAVPVGRFPAFGSVLTGDDPGRESAMINGERRETR